MSDKHSQMSFSWASNCFSSTESKWVFTHHEDRNSYIQYTQVNKVSKKIHDFKGKLFLNNVLPFQYLQKIPTVKRVNKEILILKISNLQYIFSL